MVLFKIFRKIKRYLHHYSKYFVSNFSFNLSVYQPLLVREKAGEIRVSKKLKNDVSQM